MDASTTSILRYQMVAGIFRGEIAVHEHKQLLVLRADPRRGNGARRAHNSHRGLRRLHNRKSKASAREQMSVVTREALLFDERVFLGQ
jgi:hypothetical protein